VSWTDEGAGRGVGSELNPAMAALVMASNKGSPAEKGFEGFEASPRLSGGVPSPGLHTLPNDIDGIGLTAVLLNNPYHTSPHPCP